jgi:hypothetical protein
MVVSTQHGVLTISGEELMIGCIARPERDEKLRLTTGWSR